MGDIREAREETITVIWARHGRWFGPRTNCLLHRVVELLK